MRYRAINNYFDVVFANPDVYDSSYIRILMQTTEYRISKDVVAFLAHGSDPFIYFIPETHPLYNYGLGNIRNSDEELHEQLQEVIIKQLLSIIEK